MEGGKVSYGSRDWSREIVVREGELLKFQQRPKFRRDAIVEIIIIELESQEVKTLGEISRNSTSQSVVAQDQVSKPEQAPDFRRNETMQRVVCEVQVLEE